MATFDENAPPKCCFCRASLESEPQQVECTDCAAVFCVMCLQEGREGGAHKRAHGYEINKADAVAVERGLFTRRWTRDEDQELINAAHSYKMGNWQEVATVCSKDGKSRTAAGVAHHYQKNFVLGTLGQVAMREGEWTERRGQFKDDPSSILSDPSGRELYYHAVLEALRRTAHSLPDYNDKDGSLVEVVDDMVERYFDGLQRSERKRRLSEQLSSPTEAGSTPREVFPYGESDDECWWEKMIKEPREKKEIDRYYDTQDVCTEERCMAERVDDESLDLAEIMRMMKEVGLDEDAALGEQFQQLCASDCGIPENWKGDKKDEHDANPLRKEPEPQPKRMKVVHSDATDRPHLAVDMHREVLLEAEIKDKEQLKLLEGKKFFTTTMKMSKADGPTKKSKKNDQAAKNIDYAVEISKTNKTSPQKPKEQKRKNEESPKASKRKSKQSATATRADAVVPPRVVAEFDYAAYEAKMRAAGYDTDEMYSDWDEEGKEEITRQLRELFESGQLDSSDDVHDEDSDGNALVEGLEASAPESDEDAPRRSMKQKKKVTRRRRIQSSDEEEDEEESAQDSVTDYECEEDALDAMYGVHAMRRPKEANEMKVHGKDKKRHGKEKSEDTKKGVSTIKLYELGSDDEYHTVDEEAAVAAVEMRVGRVGRAEIAARLRERIDEYYEYNEETQRYVPRIPRPALCSTLEADITQYGLRLLDRVARDGLQPHSAPETIDEDDRDKTPEARFGDGDETARSYLVHLPDFQRSLMEHFLYGADVDDSDSDVDSISDEYGEQLMAFLAAKTATTPISKTKKEAEKMGKKTAEDGAVDASKKATDDSEKPKSPKKRGRPPKADSKANDESMEVESQGSAESLYMLAEGADAWAQEEEGNVDDDAHLENPDDDDDAFHGAHCDCSSCKAERGEKVDEDALQGDEEPIGDVIEGGEDWACAHDRETHCLCVNCAKMRWNEQREKELLREIKKSGTKAQVKSALRRLGQISRASKAEDSDSSDDAYYDNEHEPEEVLVDAVQLDEHRWRLNLEPSRPPSDLTAINRSQHFDDASKAAQPSISEEGTADSTESLNKEYDMVESLTDDGSQEASEEPGEQLSSASGPSSSQPSSSVKTPPRKTEKVKKIKEEEDVDLDKTPPMLQSDEQREEEEEVEHPKTPILVIKKQVAARGRTNLTVETRPRTPQSPTKEKGEKKSAEKGKKAKSKHEEDDSPAPAKHSPPPPKKKKISREFQLLFKDNEIRKWEESQAKTLKDRAKKTEKAFGTDRVKYRKTGTTVNVSDEESEHDPRKKKRKTVDGTPTTSLSTPPPSSVEDLPARVAKTDSRGKSSSPKKGKKEEEKEKTAEKKAIKQEAEEEEESEGSSGEEEEEEVEETNANDGKTPSKRRKRKRIWVSKKERKAKWNKKIQNRKEREEKKEEAKKAVVSSIEFFEQHERTFFSNVFRRLPFDYEDHGFRNRTNFKSWTSDLFHMGYNDNRDDFEVEYYNEAEKIVSHLNITNPEKPTARERMALDMENEIKLAKVDRYMRVIQERRALRNQAAEYETLPDFFQLCNRMENERRKLKDIVKAKVKAEDIEGKLVTILSRDELQDMKATRARLMKMRNRVEKLKELHAAGVKTLDGHESLARFKPRTKFGRTEEQKKVDERERGAILAFDERIACELERLSLLPGRPRDEEREPSALEQ